jgi:uncharacterized membrane protein
MRQRTLWLSSLGFGAAITAVFGRATAHLFRRRADDTQTFRPGLRHRTRGVAAPADKPSSDAVPADARTPSDIEPHAWAPATRAIAAGAGALLVGAGVVRRDRTGAGLAAAGAALMGRAATNLPFHCLVGIGTVGSAIDVHKAITIDLPADRVFAFWDNPANLPTVMHYVRDVRLTEVRGRWRWTVSGAAGKPIEFITVITDRVPDRLLAWKTVEGSTVEHTGTVRFDALDERRTRIGLRLSYNPPAGASDKAAATVLGTDPKRQVDTDLMRMKTTLETGRRADDMAGQA